MKKLIKTVAVLMAAALAVGSLASCKMEVKSGDAIRPWKGQDKQEGTAYTIEIEIPAKADPVKWYCVTKDNGEIIKQEKNGGGFSTPITLTLSEDALKYQVGEEKNGDPKMKTASKVRLYLSNGATEKDKPSNKRDSRGSVKLYKDAKNVIKSTEYSQTVPEQTTIAVKNTEPNTTGGSYYYQKGNQSLPVWEKGKKSTKTVTTDEFTGDYTVNEIWLLRKVGKDEDKKFDTDDDLMYKEVFIPANDTKNFLIPAGAGNLLTVRQNNRAVSKEGVKAETVLYKNKKFGERKGNKRTVYYYMADGTIDDTAYQDWNLELSDNLGNWSEIKSIPSGDKAYCLVSSTEIDNKNKEYWGCLLYENTKTPHSTYPFETFKDSDGYNSIKLKKSAFSFSAKSADDGYMSFTVEE